MADERIVQYIVENRERYTEAALREQLVAAGHDPQVIDAAFRVAEAERHLTRTVDLRRPAAGIAVLGYAVAWLLFGVALTGGGPALASAGMLLLGGYLGLGLLLSLAVIAASGGLRRVDPDRLVVALVAGLAIPFVILFGLVGLCAWFIGNLRF